MYYPNWIKEDSYTLKGSMLEARTEQEGGIWKNKDFGKGYADNWGSDMAKDDNGNYRYNQFDLDDAVDQNGNPVTLERIHFVSVNRGGWIQSFLKSCSKSWIYLRSSLAKDK